MKFTMSWLATHLETEASVDEIAETLTDLGLEVEEVSDPTAALGAFEVGRVEAAEQHPDADRLRVCRVATGGGERQIICGAPNARAGITVVVARPGTYVPGIDTTIETGKIRGVESQGMLCSARELGLGDEHDGIMELEAGEVGAPFDAWLRDHAPGRADPMIEIAITPNRPDALGVEGIARDLAARGLGRRIDHPATPVEGAFPCPIGVTVDADTRDGCPLFAGRLIRGVTNGPSPDWLRERLEAIGLRPISALVDITNFLTFDRNRPLHVFDAEKVAGDLRVHRAAGGETLAALDERTYEVPAGTILISDDSGPESLAGIMGGAASGVSETTRDVFLESAYWNPVQIALAARAMRINSDAKYRFERGVDPAFTLPGLEVATRLILDICGGEASEVVSAGAVPEDDRAFPLDTDRVQSLVGMTIAPERQREILGDLGFAVDGDTVRPPSWRPDVGGSADLVEEVARIESLTRLTPQPLPRPEVGVPAPVLTLGQTREGTLRRRAAALGYNECVTYSFVDGATAALFGGGTDATRLENPITQDLTHMRPSLLAGLLSAAARNQARGAGELALFEVGPVFDGGEPGAQRAEVAGLLVGRNSPRDVHGGRRAVDVFDAKADVEALLAAVGAPRPQVFRDVDGHWHPGRSGRLALGPKTMAVFGEVHPRVLRAMDVAGPAVAFAMWPEAVPVPKRSGAAKGAMAASDLMAVTRDFAFVVDAGVEAGTLAAAAQGADKRLIDEVRVFDEFVGGSLGEGRKSLAIAVTLQPRERTLTEAEIEAVSAKIVAKVETATGGSLRR